jgi:hypothetical protein
MHSEFRQGEREVACAGEECSMCERPHNNEDHEMCEYCEAVNAAGSEPAARALVLAARAEWKSTPTSSWKRECAKWDFIKLKRAWGVAYPVAPPLHYASEAR